MKKVKALALFSTAVLVTASTGVYADEVISDGTTSPSTEQVEPTPAPSSEVVTPSDDSNTPSSSSEATEPETPGANESIPGISEDEPSNPDSEITEPEMPDEPEQTSTEPTEPIEQPVTIEVPTTDGGSATVTPDTSVSTNNPNISAETAAQAGASQVGTTSQVTGQIVQDVTTDSPVYTNTGATIVSTQDSQVVLSDGTITSPEAIGATTNSDGTISVTTSTGEITTLPKTGDELTPLNIILSAFGVFLFALGIFGIRRKENKH